MSKLFRRGSNNTDTTSSSPPAYSADPSPDRPPPFVDFPSSYRIGKQDASLVPLSAIKSHLKLLGSFHKLRTTVEAETTGWAGNLEPKARWSVFVCVAVNRFEKYLDVLATSSEVGSVIPLDVALVLHSYQLNPRSFPSFLAPCFPAYIPHSPQRTSRRT
jgi:hypothetical protein